MLDRICAEQLYLASGRGHTGRFHFAYGDYHNPANGPFGVLEALNDFCVQSGEGFDPHTHADVEIVSYCVAGELTHSDNLGHVEILRRGDVGYQCAGSGITHEEKNRSPDQPLRFVQLLLRPSVPQLTPGYRFHRPAPRDRRNRWLPVVSRRLARGAVQISQDANIHVSEVDRGRRLAYSPARGRQAYLVCLEGSLSVNGLALEQGDALKAWEVDGLCLEARTHAHLLLVDVAQASAAGG
jgi:quercetin 2,3-dioxygenase